MRAAKSWRPPRIFLLFFFVPAPSSSSPSRILSSQVDVQLLTEKGNVSSLCFIQLFDCMGNDEVSPRNKEDILVMLDFQSRVQKCVTNKDLDLLHTLSITVN